MVPNQWILGTNIFEIFYKALNISSRAMAYATAGGAFIGLHWEAATEVLDKISLTNEGGILKRLRGVLALMLLKIPITKEQLMSQRCKKFHRRGPRLGCLLSSLQQ